MLGRLLLPLLFLSMPALATEVYQTTDEQGNPVYSDVSNEDSKTITIQDPNVGDSVEVPPPSPDPEPEPEPVKKTEPPDEELIPVKEKDNNDGRRRWNLRPRPRPHPQRGR